MPLLQDASGRLLSENETSEVFRSAYARRAQTPPLDDDVDWVPNPRSGVLDLPFSTAEFDGVLALIRATAPGIDNITVPMIRHLPPAASGFLLSIFNASWYSGIIPASWRLGIVLPFRKPGRDASSVANFRPITLLSVIGKILERLVLRRIQWWLETTTWWSPTIHGGVPGRSVLSALAVLVETIRSTLSVGNSLAVAFLDLTAAYDSISVQAVLNAFRSAGFSRGVLQWFNSFLAPRKLFVQVGSVMSSAFDYCRGIPQGSALSPVLFAMGTNDMSKRVPCPLSVQYVDDAAVGVGSTSPERAIRGLCARLPALSAWAGSKALSFNAEKSVVVVFTLSNWDVDSVTVPFVGQQIPISTSTRYLGLYVDARLTWKIHVRHVVSSGRRRLAGIRMFGGFAWGASFVARRRLFLALFQPMLDFGVAFFGTSAASTLRPIDVLYHEGLRWVTGLPRSTFLAALYIEANCLPPALRREFLIISTWSTVTAQPAVKAVLDKLPFGTRARSLGVQSISTAVSSFSSVKVLESSVELRAAPESTAPWTTSPLNRLQGPHFIKSDQSPRNEIMLRDWHLSLGSPTEIYTDASIANDGHTAAGFWVPSSTDPSAIELPKGLSIFTAELFAISLAVSWACANPTRAPFQILSDSLSAVTALTSPVNRSRRSTVSAIQVRAAKLTATGKVLSLSWIPSHSGIRGNDAVDTLVSTVRPLPFPEQLLGAPDRRQILCGEVKLIWIRTWRMQCHPLKLIRPHPSIRVIDSLPHRSWEQCLARARVNRLPLRANRYRWGNVTDPNCVWCPEADTPRHRLLDCTRSTYIRLRVLAMFPDLKSNSNALLALLLGVGPRANRLPMCFYNIIVAILSAP